ncbi:hypothetical protein ESA94_17320 [Lacibacter luteus]|uniref:Adhesin domain-containing protein n=1 Tax=Lacibacter luteus TaxID=2508719 RepID=A0A4Q1CF47_9BACT|nr:hypothetical protein [Lacibacter luteus]RXK58399.1 hypothetical protein ESA94_17320 [Lacibacter luteus]
MNLVLKSFTGIVLLFLTLQATAQQNEQKHERKRYEHVKERTVSKTYSSSGATLNIENSFGDVTITTWNKNEIKVDVHIEASSSDKELAEKMFENLDVTDSKDGNEIKFKTTTSKNKNNNINCKNCKVSMNITYSIQLPASVPLKIENSFGAISLPDYNGPVSLVSKFGSLTAGNLSSVQKLEVEFGKANLKNLNDANTTFKFSTVSIENMKGDNKVNLSFCSSSRIVIDNDVTSLQLNESYSTVNLKPSSNFSGTYSIKTSFGTVTDRSNANIKRTDQPDKYGPDSNRSYEGKSGSGSSKVEVKSSFGKIIIGQATEEDMKEKKKEKKKEVI